MGNVSDDSKTPGPPVIDRRDFATAEHEHKPSGVSGGADCPVNFTEVRGKHLDMLLGMVCQMSGASAATRRYCLCLAAVALLATQLTGQPAYVVLMVGLAFVFWVLDAGYSRRQRSFERLYEDVRTEPHDLRPDFRIAPSAERSNVWCTVRTFLGGPRVLVYPPVIALLVFTGFWL